MTPIARTKSPRVGQTSAHARFLEDVREGLGRAQKELPCKYFYDDRGSLLFDDICELDEYYVTRTELAILREHAPAMARAIGEDCTLIEFGSGSSLKTPLLLECLRGLRAYVPVDIARDHLLRSARALARRFPRLAVRPIHADFTAPFAVPRDPDPLARRVVYFPGSTIGNFSPDGATALLRQIAHLVGPGGGLLIGFDLEKSAEILEPAYDDAKGVTAAFNKNILARINRELGGDFDLDAFGHRAFYAPERERVEMHLVSLRPQSVSISGASYSFRAGETIHTECSHKYSAARFAELAHAAGFTPLAIWSDPRNWFSVQYLEVV